MDATLKKILAMLSSGDEELQCAAARVLGKMESGQAQVIQALGAATSSPPISLRCAALEALGNTGRAEALRYILPHLTSAQVGERNQAISATVSLGPDVLPKVFKELGGDEPVARLALLAVLQRYPVVQAIDFLLEFLGDTEDQQVVDAICENFRKKTDGMTDAQREEIASSIHHWAGKTGTRKNEAALVAGLRLLGSLRNSGSYPFYLKLLEQETAAPRVQRHVLLGLGKLHLPEKDHAKLWAKLIRFLKADKHPPLVQAAAELAAHLKIAATEEKDVISLLEHRDSEVRLVAVKHLAGFGSAMAGKALGKCLASSDWRFRQEVLASLRLCPNAGEVLLEYLGGMDDPEALRQVTPLILELKPALSPQQSQGMFERALALKQAGDHRADPFLAILSTLDSDAYSKHVIRQGKELLRKGAYPETAACLGLLAGRETQTLEAKYLLAVARFKLSDKGLHRTEREANRSLSLFAELVVLMGPELADRLTGEKGLLGRSEIYYLGFHFSEQMGNLREFGGKLLQHLAKSAGRSPEGKDARNKLKSCGLE